MALHVGTACPSLQGATEWIGDNINIQDLIGSPFIIIFWGMSCPSCVGHLLSMQNWQDEYISSGLKILTVHSPRVPSDCDVIAVKHFLQSRDIVLPCAIDNDRILAKKFQTEEIWPYYFLFGRDGKMKSRAASSVGLRLLERSLMRDVK